MKLFIALEGIDGSGGSTHSKLLCEWLKKEILSPDEVFLTREPSDLPIGLLMRDYLKKKEIHPAVDALLYAADRTDHFFRIIDTPENKDKIVISDRHKLSSLAYQSSQGLQTKWIQTINALVPLPDLSIILDIEPTESLIRKEKSISSSKDKFETIEFLKRVREKYLELASRYENIVVVSSENSIEKTQSEIRSIIFSFLKKNKKIV